MIDTIAEHELLLELLKELSTTLNINEQFVDSSDVLNVDLGALALLSNKVGSRDEMNAVTQRVVSANLGKQLHTLARDLDVLFLTTDVEDLADLLLGVGSRRNNEGTIEQIDGETVRRQIVGASNLGNTTVSSHNDDGSLVGLESTIEEREALNVEHMDLINEQDTGHDLGAALLSPLGNLLVNLLTDLGLDLTNITSEESHEALGARVDDVDLVKGDSVHDLLSLLELTLGALNVSGLRTLVIKITGARERATKLGDLATSLVDRDDVASHDLLLLDGLDHLDTEVEHGLHLSSLERDLASLGTTLGGLVNFNLDDLTFNEFGLFSDTNTCKKKKIRLAKVFENVLVL